MAPPQPTPPPTASRRVAASVRPPCGSPGLPAAAAFVVRLSGPGDATGRQEAVAEATLPLPRCPPRPRLRPEGRRPHARILPASARLAAFHVPGPRQVFGKACVRWSSLPGTSLETPETLFRPHVDGVTFGGR
ncbi:uncharacterized protein LOC132681975 isoform X2 [Panthera onca]